MAYKPGTLSDQNSSNLNEHINTNTVVVFINIPLSFNTYIKIPIAKSGQTLVASEIVSQEDIKGDLWDTRNSSVLCCWVDSYDRMVLFIQNSKGGAGVLQ